VHAANGRAIRIDGTLRETWIVKLTVDQRAALAGAFLAGFGPVIIARQFCQRLSDFFSVKLGHLIIRNKGQMVKEFHIRQKLVNSFINVQVTDSEYKLTFFHISPLRELFSKFGRIKTIRAGKFLNCNLYCNTRISLITSGLYFLDFREGDSLQESEIEVEHNIVEASPFIWGSSWRIQL
jgi:hypothetical protein